MGRISEIAREMKTWWSDEGSDIEVQDALDEIIRLDEAEQTEPNSSEKPNNCEACEHWNDIEDGCADRHGCKDEPQTDCPWK